MTITIQLFAQARELAGADQVQLSAASPVTLDELKRILEETVPALRGLPGRWAVNLEFEEGEYLVQEQDELAWIPPVSGG